jgi:hypothetical protein
MRLIVYTAAIGETDSVRPPAVIDPDVRYLCFSDKPCPLPYEWIQVPTEEDGTPASRRIKVLANHPLLEEAAATFWHDASFRLLGDLSWVRLALETADLVALRHPRRTTIEAEGVAIARYGYVTTTEAAALTAGYRAAGYGDVGLTFGGLIGRRGSPAVKAFNRLWWAQVQRWRYRDQASLGYAAWLASALIAHVPGTPRENPYAAWRVRPMVPA